MPLSALPRRSLSDGASNWVLLGVAGAGPGPDPGPDPDPDPEANPNLNQIIIIQNHL